ncbi:MAG: hypothetical protein AAF614_39510 [Chloroflexota bacterium]
MLHVVSPFLLLRGRGETDAKGREALGNGAGVPVPPVRWVVFSRKRPFWWKA